jgi:hypothetical protein
MTRPDWSAEHQCEFVGRALSIQSAEIELGRENHWMYTWLNSDNYSQLLTGASLGEVELPALLLGQNEKTTQLDSALRVKRKVDGGTAARKDAHFSTELALTRAGSRL